MTTCKQIAAAALAWTGTPYHHQASVRGVGTDCLGLVRGVWREMIGPEPDLIPNYSPSWDEVAKTEIMKAAFDAHMKPRKITRRGPGVVLLFRYRADLPAKHCAIMTSKTTMVHSHSGRSVVEVELSDWWSRKIVAAYVYPGCK